MFELGIEVVIIGLLIFSLIKIGLFVFLSEKFLPKVAPKTSKKPSKTYYLKKGDSTIDPALKYKRDYFR